MIFKNKDKELNSFEIQKIENIFRNCHLHTKDKVNIRYSSVDKEYIVYYLKLSNKIHIELFAGKHSYAGEDSYRNIISSNYYKDQKVDKNSYRKLPNPSNLPKELYPFKILQIRSLVWIKNAYKNRDGWKEICTYNFWLDYELKTYEGFLGETTEYSNKWEKELILEFDKIGKEFIKKTFSGIKKISKKEKFANLEKGSKKFSN